MKPLSERRAERDLFFWTARQAIKLVAEVAVTIYFVVSLTGHGPGLDLAAKLWALL